MRRSGTILVVSALMAAVLAPAPQAAWAGPATEVDEEVETVRVVLDWAPNTNHTGIYVAAAQGFYADEGLRVEIVQPAESSAEPIVAAGRGDFGISHQEAVTFARTARNPVPIVAIAAILQRNTSGIVAAGDGLVTSLVDLDGGRYGGWGTEFEVAVVRAAMRASGVDAPTIEVRNIGQTDVLRAIEQGMIDFAWVFFGWDGVRAELEGIDVWYRPLVEVDASLDYYTPVIIASEELLSDRPDLARRFLAATERGYRATVENAKDAARLLTEAVPQIDVVHAERSLEYLAPGMLDEEGRWGVMESGPWDRFSRFMLESALLEFPLDVEEAYTNRFLSAGADTSDEGADESGNVETPSD